MYISVIVNAVLFLVGCPPLAEGSSSARNVRHINIVRLFVTFIRPLSHTSIQNTHSKKINVKVCSNPMDYRSQVVLNSGPVA